MGKKLTKHSTRRERQRVRRHRRVRKNVNGTLARPRLAVFRSNKHIYAQVIDDTTGQTLAASSTLTAAVKTALSGGDDGPRDKKAAAKAVGQDIARLCEEKKITTIVFDRGGYLYSGGRVRALADGAREGGLKF